MGLSAPPSHLVPAETHQPVGVRRGSTLLVCFQPLDEVLESPCGPQVQGRKREPPHDHVEVRINQTWQHDCPHEVRGVHRLRHGGRPASHIHDAASHGIHGEPGRSRKLRRRGRRKSALAKQMLPMFCVCVCKPAAPGPSRQHPEARGRDTREQTAGKLAAWSGNSVSAGGRTPPAEPAGCVLSGSFFCET